MLSCFCAWMLCGCSLMDRVRGLGLRRLRPAFTLDISFLSLPLPVDDDADEMPRRQYELTVRQEPKQARMCGIGGKGLSILLPHSFTMTIY